VSAASGTEKRPGLVSRAQGGGGDGRCVVTMDLSTREGLRPHRVGPAHQYGLGFQSSTSLASESNRVQRGLGLFVVTRA
jgi:hypothetical protein